MKDRDSLHRFLFENLPIRGEIAHLDTTWRTVLEHRDYPAVIRRLLGEAMAATSLLAATIKFQGLLTLQIQGQGPLTLLLVQCTSEHNLRGLARWEGDVEKAPLNLLCRGGMLTITIDPGEGGERYQGIVDLTGTSLSSALENYFDRSEQLPTRLHLSANEHTAAGLMLQRLPGETPDPDAWNRIDILGATVSAGELLTLNAQDIIRRLFRQEDVRLFESQPLQFRCTCSSERIQSMLRALGHQEVKDILAEEGRVNVTCEFCGKQYGFDPIDAEALFVEGSPAISQTRH